MQPLKAAIEAHVAVMNDEKSSPDERIASKTAVYAALDEAIEAASKHVKKN